MPSPYKEDIATTRDSDVYLAKNNLSTVEKASIGQSSSSATMNEQLKTIPSDEIISKEELAVFLGDGKKPKIDENFAYLLTRKLYKLYQLTSSSEKKIKVSEENFKKRFKEILPLFL